MGKHRPLGLFWGYLSDPAKDLEEKQRGIKGQEEQFEEFTLNTHPLGEFFLAQYHAVNGRHDGDGAKVNNT